MKGFMTGACWSALIACAWALGIAPLSAHAQEVRASARIETSYSLHGGALFGLPTEDGRVKWPVGLWLLVSDESEASRDQLELAIYCATKQARKGKVNHAVIAFGLDAVHDLRQQLRPNKGTMYAGNYAEAVRFLDRAERGFTRMKMMDSSPRDASLDRGTSAGRAPGLRGERRHSSTSE